MFKKLFGLVGSKNISWCKKFSGVCGLDKSKQNVSHYLNPQDMSAFYICNQKSLGSKVGYVSKQNSSKSSVMFYNLLFFLLLGGMFLISFSYKNVLAKVNEIKAEEQSIITIETKDGLIKIKTFDTIAPKTTARIKELAKSGFYNGIVFHRVIDGFMAQTGDPTGTGSGGSGKNLQAEFSNISHKRGIVSMARASDVNSADSQFFIVLQDSPFLDGKYTVFGKVIEGMDVVDKIKKADPSNPSGTVQNPDKMIKVSFNG